jgi:nitroreductase
MNKLMNTEMERFEILSDIIRNRRAVFPAMYIDKEIKDEIILQILENANWAPTHRKTEPWRFKIFKGPGLLEMSDFLSECYIKNTTKDNFSQKKYEKTKNKPLKCGAVIAICMQRNEQELIPEWEEESAVACAVQNMWLSCSTLGIGSYWSTPKAIYKAKEFLGLKEGEKCLGLFYMGYMKDVELNSERGDIKNKIAWRK